MTFATITFVAFFAGVLLLYYMIPVKLRNVFLLLISYFYYACWSTKYVLLLAAVTLFTYFGGRLIARCNENRARKKAVLISCLVICFGCLFFFKYWNFAVDSANRLLQACNLTWVLPNLSFIMPVGISFFTFQAVGYLIDVYRGDVEPERNIIDYALFVSFFLQILAGPINRATSLLKQIKKQRRFSYNQLTDGFLTLLWGYFLKCIISDRVAIAVNTVYADYANFAGIYVLIAVLLYSFQIYCDFCGYSYIAIGAARMLGLEMINNFDVPYMSRSIREFWRRWHISLSSWFRDYLYFPLGGSRTTTFKRYRNLIIVFLVSGIWHGASWTFVAWGLYHGLLQVGEAIVEKTKKRLQIPAKEKGLGHMISTFLLVTFGWVLFRANDFSSVVGMVKHTVCNFNFAAILDSNKLFAMGLDAKNWNLLIISLLTLICAEALKNNGFGLKQWFYKQNILIKDVLVIILIVVIVVAGVWGNGYDAANFIYTQF